MHYPFFITSNYTEELRERRDFNIKLREFGEFSTGLKEGTEILTLTERQSSTSFQLVDHKQGCLCYFISHREIETQRYFGCDLSHPKTL